jgi:hypothetical protein
LPGRVQGKTEKRKSADTGQRRDRLRLRRHAAAERLAAGKHREPRAAPRGLRRGSAHRGMRDRRGIRPLAALFHIRELEAQRRDAVLAQPARHLLHERMGHPRTRAMGEDKARPRRWRLEQQRGDGLRAIDLQFQFLRADAFHLAFA